MPVFSHPEFDAHEIVAFHHDRKSGLKAIIAVHNTHLGRGLGGCRMYPYSSDEAALTDVLRLSRGMTYKAALAGLKQGGGKSVILGDPRTQKTPELMRAMGRFVETLGGKYVVAEDSGTSVDDIRLMAGETTYIGGLAHDAGPDGRTGDPSPATAYGCFVGLKAAVKHQLGRDDLSGLKVAIQGVGNVGFRLARHLHEAGAQLWVTDLYQPSVQRCIEAFAATPVSMDGIFDLAVDVFAPCALGAILNDDTVPRLKTTVIAGAANNQLARPRHGRALRDRGILYAPDYVINAGGIIDIYYEGEFYRWETVESHLQEIGKTLTTIFERARDEHAATGEVADRMAEEIFRR